MNAHPPTPHRAFPSFMLKAAKGFCIGAADLVPGVSGGTMAWILGIYPALIAAIHSVDSAVLRDLRRAQLRAALVRPHWHVILPVGLGMLTAILFFTKILSLPALMQRFPEELYGLFFGLIVASIMVLLHEVKGLKWRESGWIALGIAVGLGLSGLSAHTLPDTTWALALAGMLAIGAMLLPGVSGSFVLLVLGKYGVILEAVGSGALAVLGPFLLGMLAGLIAFSRAIGWLLVHYRRHTVLVMNGLLIGSLRAVWPFQEDGPGSAPLWPEQAFTELWPVWGMMAVGLLLVGLLYFLSLTGQKRAEGLPKI